MLGVTVTIFKRKALENVIHSFFYSFIHLFMYLCIDVSAALHWRTNSVISSQSALFGCPHTSGRVVQPVCDVSMVSSLSLSLLFSAGRVVLGRPSGLMIQSRFVFYFAAGCVLFARCYMLHEISLLAERERERAHHSIRNILRLSGQQAQTQQVVERVSVSSLLLISHWLDWYWGWWDG